MYNQNEYWKTYYEKNKEKILKKNRASSKKYTKEYYYRHRNDANFKLKRATYRKSHTESIKNSRRSYGIRIKASVFTHYGLSCACCGESQFDFLTIDHINGGGQKHIREINGKLYQWLIKNNFPEGFQTLCYNCNCGKGQGSICPHKR